MKFKLSAVFVHQCILHTLLVNILNCMIAHTTKRNYIYAYIYIYIYACLYKNHSVVYLDRPALFSICIWSPFVHSETSVWSCILFMWPTDPKLYLIWLIMILLFIRLRLIHCCFTSSDPIINSSLSKDFSSCYPFKYLLIWV